VYEIDRSSGTPPWRQLADLLRARIISGELTGRLPSERYIGAEADVALVTVRKALQLLRDEGLIKTEHGWGSSVVPRDGG
jgi:DNA-binding GntR family transcriptional regulator